MSAAERLLDGIFAEDADLSEMRAMLHDEGTPPHTERSTSQGAGEEEPPGDDRTATSERPRDEHGRFVRTQEFDQAEDDGDDEDADDQADGEQGEDDEGERTPAIWRGEPPSACYSRLPTPDSRHPRSSPLMRGV